MVLATDQVDENEVKVLLRELGKVIKNRIEGDVVELGCYEGGSAVAMQELLKKHDYEKQLWLYDSFEGLPEKTGEDQSEAGRAFKPGVLRASKARLERNFFKRDLDMPEIKKAWFFELDPDDLPETVALAFLDGDFYESIVDSLRLVWPKLSMGGVVIVDDYQNRALPGVKKAVDEWVRSNDVIISVESTLAILYRK